MPLYGNSFISRTYSRPSMAIISNATPAHTRMPAQTSTDFNKYFRRCVVRSYLTYANHRDRESICIDHYGPVLKIWRGSPPRRHSCHHSDTSDITTLGLRIWSAKAQFIRQWYQIRLCHLSGNWSCVPFGPMPCSPPPTILKRMKWLRDSTTS